MSGRCISVEKAKELTGFTWINRDNIKCSEYVFKTRFGYFPREEDYEELKHILKFVNRRWKMFYETKSADMKREFLSVMIEEAKEFEENKR